MEENTFSPVPNNQIPHQEFIELKNSLFFSWPSKTIFSLYKSLFLAWLISYPLFFLVSSGSFYLQSNTFMLISISFFVSICTPLVLLFRQYLGWTYVCNRLSSEFIFYEESDWHDGQVWKKPYYWYMRDKFIVKEEVNPIILRIKNTSLILLFFTTISLIVFYLISNI